MSDLHRFSLIAVEVAETKDYCPECGGPVINGRWNPRGMKFTFCKECNKYRPAGRVEDDRSGTGKKTGL